MSAKITKSPVPVYGHIYRGISDPERYLIEHRDYGSSSNGSSSNDSSSNGSLPSKIFGSSPNDSSSNGSLPPKIFGH